jgi:hypothetical protein
MCTEKIFIVTGLYRHDNSCEVLKPLPAESPAGARKAAIDVLINTAQEAGLLVGRKFDNTKNLERVRITVCTAKKTIDLDLEATNIALDGQIPTDVAEIIMIDRKLHRRWKWKIYESEVIEDPPVEPPKIQTEVHIEKVIYIIHPSFGNKHTRPYGVFLVSDGLDTKRCRTKGDMEGDKGPQYITFKRKRYKITITGRAGNELISLKPME